MNVLPKDTLAVIMATIIASFSILFFGTISADSAEKKSNEPLLINEEKRVGSRSDDIVNTINNALTISPPPPGPFAVEESVRRSTASMNEAVSQIEVKASEIVNSSVSMPTAPSFEREQPKQTAEKLEPEFKKMQPSIPFEPVTLVAKSVIEQGKPKQIKQVARPKQEKAKLSKPTEPVNSAQAPAESKSIAEQQPKLEVSKVELNKPSLPEIHEPTVKKTIIETLKKEKLTPPSKIEFALSPLAQPVINKTMPSEPLWVKQPPISPTLHSNQPMAQYQNRQVPAQITANNMNWPPKMNQQYMYVPMPVYRSGFAYPTMMNGGYYNSGPNFGMPQIPAGINSQLKPFDSREFNNTEIK